MNQWSLLPDAQETPEEVVDEATSATTEAVESAEAPNPMDEFEKRLATLETANKQAEALATDLRRSVGRVQSIMDRMEKSTGATRAELETKLEERFGELSGLLEDVSGNIDEAILPAAVKDKVRTVRAQAAQRNAAVNIDKLVEDKIAAMTGAAAPPTGAIPPEWISFEKELESNIRSAGLDPDNRDLFDWNYAGYLMQQGRRDAVKSYFDSIIEANAPANMKLQEKKDSAPKSPTGAAAGAAAKTWWEKLDDPSVPLEEKIKLMQENKLL